MKKINILAFMFLFALVSCSETNNDAVVPTDSATVNVANTVNLSALIIGKWQLSEIGTVHSVTSSSGECGNNSSSNSSSYEEVSWSKTNASETLNFKENGAYTKYLKNDGVCEGTYQISAESLNIKSNCSTEDTVQPINALSKTELRLVKQENNEVVLFRYVRQ